MFVYFHMSKLGSGARTVQAVAAPQLIRSGNLKKTDRSRGSVRRLGLGRSEGALHLKV